MPAFFDDDPVLSERLHRGFVVWIVGAVRVVDLLWRGIYHFLDWLRSEFETINGVLHVSWPCVKSHLQLLSPLCIGRVHDLPGQ